MREMLHLQLKNSESPMHGISNINLIFGLRTPIWFLKFSYNFIIAKNTSDLSQLATINMFKECCNESRRQTTDATIHYQPAVPVKSS